MSLTGDWNPHLICPNCNGKGGYHNYPCSGAWPSQFYGPPTPPPTLTEADVRRIVNEELDKRRAP